MEGNRDESIKCVKIAQQSLAVGDKEKAIKFLKKAQRLYPSQRAKGRENEISSGESSLKNIRDEQRHH